MKVGAEPPKHASKEKKYRKDSVDQQQQKSPQKRKREDEAENDPKLKEYLAAMQPAKNQKTWADDAWQSTAPVPQQEQPAADKEKDTSGQSEEDTLTYNQKKRLKQGGDDAAYPHKIEEQHKEQAFTSEQKPDEMDVDAPAPVVAEEKPKDDMDWLRSRTSRLLGLMDEEEENEAIAKAQPSKVQTYDSDEEEEPAKGGKAQQNSTAEGTGSKPAEEEEKTTEEKQVEHDANIDQIQKTGRLFVRNLSYKIKEEELHPLFSPFGKIDEVRQFPHSQHPHIYLIYFTTSSFFNTYSWPLSYDDPT